MRLRNFQVENVLHFHQFQLDLDSSHKGLHIIHGPNEAGKSTLLRLLVDFLFGGKITDEQLYSSKSRLVGTLEATVQGSHLPAAKETAATGEHSSETTTLAFERTRKGKRLVLPNDGEVTEDLLQRLLGGLNRDRYAILFGFDHLRLRQGGDSLLQSGGHAGISLFEAGGGVQFLRSLSENFNVRTQALLDAGFRSNSSKALNAAWRQYKSLVDQSRKNRLRGEDWHRLKHHIEQIEQRIEDLQQQQNALEQRHSQLQRVGRTRRFVADLQAARRTLAAMASVVELGAELDEQIPEALAQLQKLNDALARGAEQRLGYEEELAGVPEDTAVLQAALDIQNLQKRLQLYLDAVEALPGRELQLEAQDKQGLLLIRELDAELKLADIDSLRIPFTIEEQIRQLATDWLERKRGETTLQDMTRDREDELRQVEHQLQQLGELRDVTLLRSAIEEVHRAGDMDAAVAQAKGEVTVRRRAGDALLQQQSLFTGDIATLSTLQLPLAETVSQYHERFAKLAESKNDQGRELRKTDEGLEEVLRELARLELGGQVPLEADLVDARDRRDKGWDLVKRAWIQQEEATSDFKRAAADYASGTTLDEAFEQAMRKADEVADWMRRESERFARRAQLLLQQEQFKQRREKLEEEATVLTSATERLWDDWRREWEPTGIEPRLPGEMRDWMTSFYRPLLDAKKTIDKQEQALQDLAVQRQALMDQLLQALRMDAGAVAAMEQVEGNLSLGALTKLAEEHLREADTLLQERRQLEKRLSDLQGLVRQQHEKLTHVARQAEAQDAQWHDLRATYTSLPENIALVTAYLDKVRGIFEWLKERDWIEQDKQAKEQIRDAFENAVDQLAVKLNRPLTPQVHHGQWLEEVADRLQTVQKWEEQRQHLRREVQRIDEGIAKLMPQQKRLQSEIDGYMKQYGCEDAADLRSLVGQSVEKRTLRESILELEETLRQAGDDLTVEALVQEVLEAPDVDALPIELRTVEAEISDLQNEAAEQNRDLGASKQEFETMNRSNSDAADLMQQAEFQLSQVDVFWNEYLRLELAARLLRLAVDKFREENEAGIIGHAGALFKRLTLGQYAELVVEYDGDTPVLEAVAVSGEKRRVGELSDGTRDQLYLALRLAFVEQHIQSVGPVPVIMDDILVHFDDERTKVTLELLEELGTKTQILYFTHHQSVVAAGRSLAAIHELGAGSR